MPAASAALRVPTRGARLARLAAKPASLPLELTPATTLCALGPVVALALVYSLSVNSLSLFESTMCLKFIGGEGCDEADQQAKASVPIAAHTRYAANHTANGTIELARGALLY